MVFCARQSPTHAPGLPHPHSPAVQPPLEKVLEPLRLPWDLRLTPEQFERVCQANRDAVLELATDGQRIAMTPRENETSGHNGEILDQLRGFTQRHPNGRMFDSSGVFRLADGCVFRTEAALLSQNRWQAFTPEERCGFLPLCPDLVVELASPSDEGPRGMSALRRKMARYQANGAQIGWLLLPEERAVEIWRGGAEGMAERLENASRLEAGEALAGLVLNLDDIWAV